MIYRATVTGTTRDGVWVRIPSLYGADDLGPVQSVPEDLTPGEDVLVALVGGSSRDVVVLSRGNETHVAAAVLALIEERIAANRQTVAIPAAADLNDYIAPDDYHQSMNASAASGSNYPVALAGLLEVRTGATMVYQRYTTYSTSRVFVRGRYGSTWAAWRELADTSRATPSIDGLMAKEDKAKLDAAAYDTPPNTLVATNASGYTKVKAAFVNESTPQQIQAHALTRKDYVDAQIATRSASGHRHTYGDIDGLVPTSALPPLAVVDTFTASSQAAMLALTAQRGDMCIRTDSVRTYVLTADTPSVLASWKEITAAGQVTSVAGKTGTVILTKADVGLGSVSNTSDAAKPVSTATQTALNAKAALASPNFTGTVDAPILRLSSTADASETSTGHALQIGPDSGNNLIMDNDEIIGRNNGALSPIFMPGGIGSLPAPAGDSYAANKAYVDIWQVPTALASSGTDLNNYTTTGTWHQSGNGGASAGTNYPVGLAGLLEVFGSGSMVYQRYTEYNTGIIHSRSKYASTWSPWSEVAQEGSWAKLGLQYGWSEYAGGGDYKNGCWSRRFGTSVQVVGMVRAGAVGSPIAQLPAGHRPSNSHLIPAVSAAAYGAVQFDVGSGFIKYAVGPAAPSYLAFSFTLPIG